MQVTTTQHGRDGKVLRTWLPARASTAGKAAAGARCNARRQSQGHRLAKWPQLGKLSAPAPQTPAAPPVNGVRLHSAFILTATWD